MSKKTAEKCCETSEKQDVYDVEAIATIDERGQLVIPKSIRDRAGLSPGDRLALVTMEKDGEVCCIHLFKTKHLTGGVREILGNARN